MRKLASLCMMVCVVGLLTAQTKDKDKATKDPNEVPKVKGTLVKVDAEKMVLSVKIGEKQTSFNVGKKVKFVGPNGGDTDIKDKRLKTGVVLDLVFEGKSLKEVHIPVIKSKDKEK